MSKMSDLALAIEDRCCTRCKHYVKQSDKRTETLYGSIYGCEKWNCEFEAKEIKNEVHHNVRW